jgi:hypothetical protein
VDKIEHTRAEEITTLHNRIIGNLRQSLDDAIRIGQLLTEQKETLPHGDFGKWIEANLPFTDRTARNYMRLHRDRERLKTETVSDLTGAYRLLQASERAGDGESLNLHELPAEELRSIIDGINEDIRHSQYKLDPDAAWFFEHFKEMSPRNEEDLACARALTIHKFFCHLRNHVYKHGLNSLRRPLRLFARRNADLLMGEPGRLCGEHCRLYG